MKKLFRKLLLVDGSYMLHRGLRISENFDLENTLGQGIGGITQFLKSLSFEIHRGTSYFPITVWDCGLSERRVNLLSDYKSRSPQSIYRGKDEDEFLEAYAFQRDTLIEILKVMGIPAVRLNGFEGDDLIYLLSKLTEDVVVLSDDKDFYQLISENVVLSRPMAREEVSLKTLDKDGVSPELCLIQKCIMGDRSDNISNVARGLGKVNAERIARVIYDNPNNYLEILSKSDKKQDLDFVENHNNFLLNRKLIDLKEVDKDIDDDIMNIVVNEILSIMGKSNYLKVRECLGGYEIKGVNVDKIMTALSLPKRHIL